MRYSTIRFSFFVFLPVCVPVFYVCSALFVSVLCVLWAKLFEIKLMMMMMMMMMMMNRNSFC